MIVAALSMFAGFAVVAPLLASPPRAELRPLESPQEIIASSDASRAERPDDFVVHQHAEHRPAGVIVGRGAPLGMSDDLENLAPFPTRLNGQQGNAVWSDPSIKGVGRWLGTTSTGRTAYAYATNVDGNVSLKARLMATLALQPDSFLFGLRYEFLRSNDPVTRVEFAASADQPAQVEHDLFVASLGALWTSEPIHTTVGLIVSRVMWGGTCGDDCESINLPTGPLQAVHVLFADPYSFIAPYFVEARWVGSAPAGAAVGETVVMPTGQWIRVRHLLTDDHDIEHWFDFGDGTGFHLAYRGPTSPGRRIDSLGSNGSYEAANSAMYIDNIQANGVEWSPPQPPQPLICGPQDYADDLQWLVPGPLQSQHAVWIDGTWAATEVEREPGGEQVIRQRNFLGDDRHRVEFRRTLPSAAPGLGDSWTLCEEATFSGDTYSTVRAFAPASSAANSIVTRLAFGHYDPERTPAFAPRIFIQHNAAYNPVDDDLSPAPYLPGPGGNGGVARIGGAETIGDPAYDYYDTGVTFALDSPQSWCVEVAEDSSMNISYGAIPLVGVGTGVAISAFALLVDELRHESENQSAGPLDTLTIDNVFLDCADDLCGCDYPAFETPYLDHLEWAIPGVELDQHDDDDNPSTPFRWHGHAINMAAADLGDKTKALKMENVRRDRTQTQGSFSLSSQASTQLPRIEPSASRGYASSGSYKVTDGATTRAWVVAEGTLSGSVSVFSFNTKVLYSAGSGTLWVETYNPSQGTSTWINSGRTLAEFGVVPNEWFTLSTHMNLDGLFTFKINAITLTDLAGVVVRARPQQSSEGVHSTLDRLFFMSGNDSSAPIGSTLYADNIRSWALPCPGDTNDDGIVNFADINNIISVFNTETTTTSPVNVAPDLDGDGVADDNLVNFADLNAALGQFNVPCD